MNEDVRQQINALKKMTPAQLRQRYEEVFDEPTRSGNRQYLVRRIAWRLQALAEGDLSERAREWANALARDADMRVRPPGDMSLAPAPAALKRVKGRIEMTRDERLPIPGTRLKRVFKGHEYSVTVLSNGFEYNGAVYRSLSAVAHAITGSHWNGYHFFGLNKKESA